MLHESIQVRRVQDFDVLAAAGGCRRHTASCRSGRCQVRRLHTSWRSGQEPCRKQCRCGCASVTSGRHQQTYQVGAGCWRQAPPLTRKLCTLCSPPVAQSISLRAQATAAEDGRAAAGGVGSRPESKSGQAAAAAPAPPAAEPGSSPKAAELPAADAVMDQLAGLQQLVGAEAHKQLEVFDSTLKVRWDGPGSHTRSTCPQ